MKIFNDLKEITKPFKNGVITLGNFDGVHKGHQVLMDKLNDKAKEIDGVSIAITFDPHPARFFNKGERLPLITLDEQKVELLEKTGLDVLICIPFTESFASIAATEFIEDILVKRIGMKAIIVGKDYTFGKDRHGTIELLKEYAKGLDFEVIVSGWINAPGTDESRISSTRIRNIITEGRVDRAMELLGRYYQIRGKVETGRKRGGRLLGFPTANINLQDELCPKTGVYAVTVECCNEKYKGVANIGYSPTFDDNIFTVEVHIFDFDDEIYEQNIRVNFVQRLRDEKKFSDISDLIEQINRDCIKAREILSENKE
ncbi:MAG: bifunctional riboflavin kinase/FAD synthetase [Desulfobacterales bacterium]|nr:bifunctional riboflavin kinase/FAD synthetase [Desulfobacterales bacterium]